MQAVHHKVYHIQNLTSLHPAPDNILWQLGSNVKLVKALTRGNGEIGEVITNNAKTFVNIPGRIQYTGTLIVRGEALIRYSDFEELNKQENVEEQYKNPRNLCSGSVRQLNNEITAKRRVHFYAYNIISIGDEI